MRTKSWICPAAVLVLLAASAAARQGKPPLSFEANVLSVDKIDHTVLRPVDVEALLLEDAMTAGKPGVPFRVAATVPVDLAVGETGTWEDLGGGARLWRLRVSSPGAYFLSFKLAGFELPWGAELRFVSVDRDHFYGPYTLRNNNPLRLFRSPTVAGDSAFLELYLPAGVAAPALRVTEVSHGYRDFRGLSQKPFRDGRGPSGLERLPKLLPLPVKAECEVDVNCPEGADWQDDKQAVAETFDGNFICTGTLLNNVREDCRYLFLTANHCTKSKGKAATLVFFWNYENSGCNTGDAPIDQTTTGSTFLAGNAQSDFTLVELTEVPPDAYNVYHAGWNRVDSPASQGIAIHHPNDLPRKISFELDPLEDGGNFSGGWGDDHWRVVGWDIGTTEPGSSGSGLWNPAHQVVGQLHGGIADCSGGWDEYGKLAASWLNGAAQHLDPDGTGANSVNGLDCTAGGPPPPPCEGGLVGDPCNVDSDCCSNKCKGPAGGKTCR